MATKLTPTQTRILGLITGNTSDRDAPSCELMTKHNAGRKGFVSLTIWEDSWQALCDKGAEIGQGTYRAIRSQVFISRRGKIRQY